MFLIKRDKAKETTRMFVNKELCNLNRAPDIKVVKRITGNPPIGRSKVRRSRSRWIYRWSDGGYQMAKDC